MWEKSRCYYVGIIELHRFKAILFCDFYEDGYFWNFLKNLFLLEFFYRGEIHLGIVEFYCWGWMKVIILWLIILWETFYFWKS